MHAKDASSTPQGVAAWSKDGRVVKATLKGLHFSNLVM